MRPLAIAALLACSAFPQTQHVTARRLNRAEYNNTIRDLLAVDFQPAADFPADDSGYGFDNIGDVLSLSPLLMEKYLAAAEKIARAATTPPPLPKPAIQRHGRGENRAPSKSPSLIVSHGFPVEGDYTILIGVAGRPDPVRAQLTLDATKFPDALVEDAVENRRTAEIRVHVTLGLHSLTAELIPTGPHAPDPEFESGKSEKPLPEPSVSSIEIRGPYNPVQPPTPESYKRVFSCTDPGEKTLECARADLANLARRAWRRPVTDVEVGNLLRFLQSALDQGDSFDQGMQYAIAAILVSPHFLFRIERDPNSGYELATRLSYFLWSSMPDEELFRLAAAQTLRKPKILDAQIRRMLSDPKSRALVDNFGGQWLELRNLDTIKPDPDRFPAFDDALRRDMKRETELFFQAIIREDRSILDFLDADYTYLNERLAKFYKIPNVEGNEFRRVALPASAHRGGILAQASILTVSSYPNRTSPVIRGKWILENLLNAAPPPPPPNVPNLDEKAISSAASLRQQLEQHRNNAVCNACHSRMDPLGFGLENYDAIGRWRTEENNVPIDATGVLPGGRAFDGPAGLKRILLSDKKAFTQCLAEKLITYALGRGLDEDDQPAVQSIVAQTAAANYKFSALVREIVQTEIARR